MPGQVAVLFTSPETIMTDYDRLLDLADVSQALPSGVPVILKDNISWHYPFPGANTTPWQLEGTIRALRARGYQELTCVQNKTVVTNAFKGEDLNHYVPVLKHYDVPILYNFRPSDMTWVPFESKLPLEVLPRIYPKGLYIPDYFVGKSIVHLPTVKCHIYTTTTGAMKNAFGGLLATNRHYTHSWIHETLVDLLKVQKQIHPGLFAVMDGTTAGDGTGPRVMKPRTKNVILASSDQVAIDAIAAKMMGFDPLSIGYIRMAHEQGLGVGDPREIEVVGDDITGIDWNFEVGVNLHRALGWLSWYGPTKFLQKLLFHTPLVHVASLVSETYHDYYRWPFREKRIFERWKRDVPWGQLFVRYEREGVLQREE
ncbi:MAG: DUF362 domain-containing protein [Chloroflexi bacterium]|nr:DUF362 domain-containing protein [Chloroflexota bacterium]